ncbi:MAG: hypothetical protein FD174_2833 [Geobacteraceae bacterium]|nr:MAG: hypothetical protein FD174_2833 [Geobacteraceae bacterium]
MKCLVCKTLKKHYAIDLHSGGFAEDIMTCSVCGAVWSVNHGLTVIVKDPQEKSFLGAQYECVEGDDYSLAA